MKRRVTILYFAQFQEARGIPKESLDTECETTGDLYKELCDRHGLFYDPNTVKVAVNEKLDRWETAIAQGDTVVFLAPFAGG